MVAASGGGGGRHSAVRFIGLAAARLVLSSYACVVALRESVFPAFVLIHFSLPPLGRKLGVAHAPRLSMLKRLKSSLSDPPLE